MGGLVGGLIVLVGGLAFTWRMNARQRKWNQENWNSKNNKEELPLAVVNGNPTYAVMGVAVDVLPAKRYQSTGTSESHESFTQHKFDQMRMQRFSTKDYEREAPVNGMAWNEGMTMKDKHANDEEFAMREDDDAEFDVINVIVPVDGAKTVVHETPAPPTAADQELHTAFVEAQAAAEDAEKVEQAFKEEEQLEEEVTKAEETVQQTAEAAKEGGKKAAADDEDGMRSDDDEEEYFGMRDDEDDPVPPPAAPRPMVAAHGSAHHAWTKLR